MKEPSNQATKDPPSELSPVVICYRTAKSISDESLLPDGLIVLQILPSADDTEQSMHSKALSKLAKLKTEHPDSFKNRIPNLQAERVCTQVGFYSYTSARVRS